MGSRDRKLRLNRPVVRREFIGGAGMALSGSLLNEIPM